MAVIQQWPVGARSVPPIARAGDGQLIGIAAAGPDLPRAIPFALEAGYDLLVLEGSGPISGQWPELAGAPDLTAIRDAIRIERELNREEDLALLFFGGVRSGTDSAKLIGLGASAAIVGLSLALAVGGRIEAGRVEFYGDASVDDRAEAAELYLKALRAEASIMPRCTGKTDIHNLEPEDLRSISVVTAEAAGIPLAGFNPKLTRTA
jgi:hypothetical protein